MSFHPRLALEQKLLLILTVDRLIHRYFKPVSTVERRLDDWLEKKIALVWLVLRMKEGGWRHIALLCRFSPIQYVLADGDQGLVALWRLVLMMDHELVLVVRSAVLLALELLHQHVSELLLVRSLVPLLILPRLADGNLQL